MADEGSKPMTNNAELTDGVGSSPSQDSTQPQFMHLPQELHDPRGVGVQSDGDEKPHFVHLPLQIRNPRGAGISMQPEGGESEPATQTQDTVTPQEVNSHSKFGHGHGLPHFHNPRGVGISPNGDPGLTLGPQVHIPHLPQLHDPRGVRIRNPRGMPIQRHGGEVDECGCQDGSENVK